MMAKRLANGSHKGSSSCDGSSIIIIRRPLRIVFRLLFIICFMMMTVSSLMTSSSLSLSLSSRHSAPSTASLSIPMLAAAHAAALVTDTSSSSTSTTTAGDCHYPPLLSIWEATIATLLAEDMLRSDPATAANYTTTTTASPLLTGISSSSTDALRCPAGMTPISLLASSVGTGITPSSTSATSLTAALFSSAALEDASSPSSTAASTTAAPQVAVVLRVEDDVRRYDDGGGGGMMRSVLICNATPPTSTLPPPAPPSSLSSAASLSTGTLHMAFPFPPPWYAARDRAVFPTGGHDAPASDACSSQPDNSSKKKLAPLVLATIAPSGGYVTGGGAVGGGEEGIAAAASQQERQRQRTATAILKATLRKPFRFTYTRRELLPSPSPPSPSTSTTNSGSANGLFKSLSFVPAVHTAQKTSKASAVTSTSSSSSSASTPTSTVVVTKTTVVATETVVDTEVRTTTATHRLTATPDGMHDRAFQTARLVDIHDTSMAAQRTFRNLVAFFDEAVLAQALAVAQYPFSLQQTTSTAPSTSSSTSGNGSSEESALEMLAALSGGSGASLSSSIDAVGFARLQTLAFPSSSSSSSSGAGSAEWNISVSLSPATTSSALSTTTSIIDAEAEADDMVRGMMLLEQQQQQEALAGISNGGSSMPSGMAAGAAVLDRSPLQVYYGPHVNSNHSNRTQFYGGREDGGGSEEDDDGSSSSSAVFFIKGHRYLLRRLVVDATLRTRTNTTTTTTIVTTTTTTTTTTSPTSLSSSPSSSSASVSAVSRSSTSARAATDAVVDAVTVRVELVPITGRLEDACALTVPDDGGSTTSSRSSSSSDSIRPEEALAFLNRSLTSTAAALTSPFPALATALPTRAFFGIPMEAAVADVDGFQQLQSDLRTALLQWWRRPNNASTTTSSNTNARNVSINALLGIPRSASIYIGNGNGGGGALSDIHYYSENSDHSTTSSPSASSASSTPLRRPRRSALASSLLLADCTRRPLVLQVPLEHVSAEVADHLTAQLRQQPRQDDSKSKGTTAPAMPLHTVRILSKRDFTDMLLLQQQRQEASSATSNPSSLEEPSPLSSPSSSWWLGAASRQYATTLLLSHNASNTTSTSSSNQNKRILTKAEVEARLLGALRDAVLPSPSPFGAGSTEIGSSSSSLSQPPAAILQAHSRRWAPERLGLTHDVPPRPLTLSPAPIHGPEAPARVLSSSASSLSLVARVAQLLLSEMALPLLQALPPGSTSRGGGSIPSSAPVVESVVVVSERPDAATTTGAGGEVTQRYALLTATPPPRPLLTVPLLPIGLPAVGITTTTTTKTAVGTSSSSSSAAATPSSPTTTTVTGGVHVPAAAVFVHYHSQRGPNASSFVCSAWSNVSDWLTALATAQHPTRWQPMPSSAAAAAGGGRTDAIRTSNATSGSHDHVFFFFDPLTVVAAPLTGRSLLLLPEKKGVVQEQSQSQPQRGGGGGGQGILSAATSSSPLSLFWNVVAASASGTTEATAVTEGSSRSSGSSIRAFLEKLLQPRIDDILSEAVAPGVAVPATTTGATGRGAVSAQQLLAQRQADVLRHRAQTTTFLLLVAHTVQECHTQRTSPTPTSSADASRQREAVRQFMQARLGPSTEDAAMEAMTHLSKELFPAPAVPASVTTSPTSTSTSFSSSSSLSTSGSSTFFALSLLQSLSAEQIPEEALAWHRLMATSSSPLPPSSFLPLTHRTAFGSDPFAWTAAPDSTAMRAAALGSLDDFVANKTSSSSSVAQQVREEEARVALARDRVLSAVHAALATACRRDTGAAVVVSAASTAASSSSAMAPPEMFLASVTSSSSSSTASAASSALSKVAQRTAVIAAITAILEQHASVTGVLDLLTSTSGGVGTTASSTPSQTRDASSSTASNSDIEWSPLVPSVAAVHVGPMRGLLLRVLTDALLLQPAASEAVSWASLATAVTVSPPLSTSSSSSSSPSYLDESGVSAASIAAFPVTVHLPQYLSDTDIMHVGAINNMLLHQLHQQQQQDASLSSSSSSPSGSASRTIPYAYPLGSQLLVHSWMRAVGTSDGDSKNNNKDGSDDYMDRSDDWLVLGGSLGVGASTSLSSSSTPFPPFQAIALSASAARQRLLDTARRVWKQRSAGNSSGRGGDGDGDDEAVLFAVVSRPLYFSDRGGVGGASPADTYYRRLFLAYRNLLLLSVTPSHGAGTYTSSLSSYSSSSSSSSLSLFPMLDQLTRQRLRKGLRAIDSAFDLIEGSISMTLSTSGTTSGSSSVPVAVAPSPLAYFAGLFQQSSSSSSSSSSPLSEAVVTVSFVGVRRRFTLLEEEEDDDSNNAAKRAVTYAADGWVERKQEDRFEEEKGTLPSSATLPASRFVSPAPRTSHALLRLFLARPSPADRPLLAAVITLGVVAGLEVVLGLLLFARRRRILRFREYLRVLTALEGDAAALGTERRGWMRRGVPAGAISSYSATRAFRDMRHADFPMSAVFHHLVSSRGDEGDNNNVQQPMTSSGRHRNNKKNGKGSGSEIVRTGRGGGFVVRGDIQFWRNPPSEPHFQFERHIRRLIQDLMHREQQEQRKHGVDDDESHHNLPRQRRRGHDVEGTDFSDGSSGGDVNGGGSPSPSTPRHATLSPTHQQQHQHTSPKISPATNEYVAQYRRMIAQQQQQHHEQQQQMQQQQQQQQEEQHEVPPQASPSGPADTTTREKKTVTIMGFHTKDSHHSHSYSNSHSNSHSRDGSRFLSADQSGAANAASGLYNLLLVPTPIVEALHRYVDETSRGCDRLQTSHHHQAPLLQTDSGARDRIRASTPPPAPPSKAATEGSRVALTQTRGGVGAALAALLAQHVSCLGPAMGRLRRQAGHPPHPPPHHRSHRHHRLLLARHHAAAGAHRAVDRFARAAVVVDAFNNIPMDLAGSLPVLQPSSNEHSSESRQWRRVDDVSGRRGFGNGGDDDGDEECHLYRAPSDALRVVGPTAGLFFGSQPTAASEEEKEETRRRGTGAAAAAAGGAEAAAPFQSAALVVCMRVVGGSGPLASGRGPAFFWGPPLLGGRRRHRASHTALVLARIRSAFRRSSVRAGIDDNREKEEGEVGGTRGNVLSVAVAAVHRGLWSSWPIQFGSSSRWTGDEGSQNDGVAEADRDFEHQDRADSDHTHVASGTAASASAAVVSHVHRPLGDRHHHRHHRDGGQEGHQHQSPTTAASTTLLREAHPPQQCVDNCSISTSNSGYVEDDDDDEDLAKHRVKNGPTTSPLPTKIENLQRSKRASSTLLPALAANARPPSPVVPIFPSCGAAEGAGDEVEMSVFEAAASKTAVGPSPLVTPPLPATRATTAATTTTTPSSYNSIYGGQTTRPLAAEKATGTAAAGAGGGRSTTFASIRTPPPPPPPPSPPPPPARTVSSIQKDDNDDDDERRRGSSRNVMLHPATEVRMRLPPAAGGSGGGGSRKK